MAQLHYHGKNGNPAIDAEKIENLRLANAIAKAKLQKLEGDLVSKRQVVFMLEYSLTLLRSQILTIPQLVASELRDLSGPQAHRVRIRVEDAVHHFLTQLAENMENAMHGEEFLAKLEASLAGKTDEDAAELKHDIGKEKRTAKGTRSNARLSSKFIRHRRAMIASIS